MISQRLPMPTPLNGPGPFETPIAEGCLGLALVQGRLPTRVVFVLEGGKELRVPMTDLAFQSLCDKLAPFCEKKP